MNLTIRKSVRFLFLIIISQAFFYSCTDNKAELAEEKLIDRFTTIISHRYLNSITSDDLSLYSKNGFELTPGPQTDRSWEYTNHSEDGKVKVRLEQDSLGTWVHSHTEIQIVGKDKDFFDNLVTSMKSKSGDDPLEAHWNSTLNYTWQIDAQTVASINGFMEDPVGVVIKLEAGFKQMEASEL